MEPADLHRAVEAGRATASEVGLQVDDVIVVHNSDRVALRLVPCDVLARVAPLGHLGDSEFEVDVARRLADVEAPVAVLDPRVEPRVYVRDAFAVSLWTYYEPVGSRSRLPTTRTCSCGTMPLCGRSIWTHRISPTESPGH